LARFIAELDDEPCGTIERAQCAHIPSPYHYSHARYVWNWNGRKVTWFETRHKHYEVYEVTA
jgi:hypothetical protein